MRKALSSARKISGKYGFRDRATAFIATSSSGLSMSTRDCIKSSHYWEHRKKVILLRTKCALLADGIEKVREQHLAKYRTNKVMQIGKKISRNWRSDSESKPILGD
jgi:hypothetical protein